MSFQQKRCHYKAVPCGRVIEAEITPLMDFSIGNSHIVFNKETGLRQGRATRYVLQSSSAGRGVDTCPMSLKHWYLDRKLQFAAHLIIPDHIETEGL